MESFYFRLRFVWGSKARCSEEPRVLRMTPGDFDAMGPRSVILWTRAHALGKSGEAKFNIITVTSR
jgi:hypothetical protein